MFTGIISEIGTVEAVDDGGGGIVTFRIATHGVLDDATHGVLDDAEPGCSIAVNGVCLTVVEHTASWFTADVMGESLAVTALGDLEVGSAVNLERAMRADGRLDGHIVQGHVDAVGELVERRPDERWEVLRFTAPADARTFCVHKGSIAIDGVSLTVSALTDDGFEVSLIPTTLEATTLGRLRPGSRVNLETDVLAKYVARHLEATTQSTAHQTTEENR